MNGITLPAPGAFARAGLFVVLAGAALAVTARPASALVLVCNGARQCITLGNSCEFWSAPPEYTCFTLGPTVFKDAHLLRDQVGGASLVNGGETIAILSDVAEATLARWAQSRRRDGSDESAADAFRAAFDAAFRSPDRAE